LFFALALDMAMTGGEGFRLRDRRVRGLTADGQTGPTITLPRMPVPHGFGDYDAVVARARDEVQGCYGADPSA